MRHRKNTVKFSRNILANQNTGFVFIAFCFT